VTGHGQYLSREDVPDGWATGNGHLAHHAEPQRRAEAVNPLAQLEVIRCELERVGCHGPVVASVRALVEELSMRRRDALAEIEEVSR